VANASPLASTPEERVMPTGAASAVQKINEPSAEVEE